MDATTDRHQSTWLCASVLVVVYLIGAALFAVNTPFPTEFDELAHLSYIKAMRDDPAFIAHQDRISLLNGDNLDEWTDQQNYLSHPPAFYSLASVLIGEHIDRTDIVAIRIFSVTLGAFAILLVITALISRMTTDAGFLTGASLMALCPMASVVAGSVGNDVVSLVAGALALLASLRLLDRGPGYGSALLAGLAFVVAALTKLNAGLLVGLYLLAVHVIAIRDWPGCQAQWLRHIITVIVFGLIGMSPYLTNLVEIGAVIPVDLSSHAAQIAGSEPWNFWRYTKWFVEALGTTWSAYEPADALERTHLLFLVGLSVVACWFSLSRTSLWIAVSALAALVVVLPIHLAFAYDLHVERLHLSAAQSRYYLALLPILSFAAAAAVDGIRQKTVQLSIAGIVVFLCFYASLMPAVVRTFYLGRG
ncbi:MAG: hypothetical protein AAF563_04430 [Pseudomonadota bacterium]